MTAKECYERMGANYNEVLRRFSDEARVTKFLKMMLSDESFPELSEAMEKADWENAFRAAHTLKGVALNLGLSRLAFSAGELTEALRDESDIPHVGELFEEVKKDYAVMQKCITELVGA